MPKKTGTTLEDLYAFCEKAREAHPQIRTSQIRFLVVIAQYSPAGITQTEAAKQLGLTLAAISRAVDVFGPDGRKDRGTPGLNYIKVSTDPDDDRPKILTITEAGMNYLLGLGF